MSQIFLGIYLLINLQCSTEPPNLGFLQDEFRGILTALHQHPRAGSITDCVILTIPLLPKYGYRHPVRRVWNFHILG